MGNAYGLILNKKHIQHLKVKLLIIIITILTVPVYSQEFLDTDVTLMMNYSYSLFNIYNGFNITEDGSSYEFTGNLVNFNLMNENTAVGIDISPIRYYYSYLTKSNILSFVNIYLYWDIYRIIHPYYFGEVLLGAPEFGPFFSINWINMDDFSSFNINKIIFSAGLKYSMGIRWSEDGKKMMNNYTYMGIETGYRNMYGKHSFFLTIYLNPLDYFWVRVIGA